MTKAAPQRTSPGCPDGVVYVPGKPGRTWIERYLRSPTGHVYYTIYADAFSAADLRAIADHMDAR